MRDADNIREVEQLFTVPLGFAAWLVQESSLFTPLMGFIFWPKSSRYVSQVPEYLPEKCKRVGVFVDASIGDVMTIAEQYQLDFIQLHGQESPSYITQLRPHLSLLNSKISIIKALNIATTADLANAKQYEGIVDYLLFDTKGKSVGGNGEKFDWSVLRSYTGTTPFLLSGGIGPDDAPLVKAVVEDLQSSFIGIDLNSKFEISPALKDVKKLQKFLNELSI